MSIALLLIPDFALISYFTVVKLIVLPITVTAHALGVSGVFFDMVVLFGALPTATSAYVVAVRMGVMGRWLRRA